MKARDRAYERLYGGIEDVLEHMIGRQQPRQTQMQDIRSRYPCPVFFVESNEFMLKRAGLGNTEAFYFWMIPGLTRYVAREAFGEKPCMNTLSRAAEYLKSLYIGIHVEQFYILMLDYRGRLIDAVMIGSGTVDAAPFDLSSMLAQVVSHDARALILCHNHPGGTMQPSEADLRCTLDALAATITINVPLLDHIIIADNRAVSIRGCGYIAPELWVMQAPKKRIVREWLDVDGIV